MKRRTLLLFLVLAGGLALFLALRSRPVDTRFSGAYRFPDGHVAGISPTGEESWRMRDFASGAVHTLYPEGEDLFTARPGWDPEAPAEGTVRLTPEGLTWNRAGQEIAAGRLALREKTARFQSGDAELQGRLVLPDGPGPHPAVVLVHGSEKDAATVFSHEGWLLAPNGIAVLIFDKRGTGSSEGKFGMDFGQLSDDVVAAVEWLRAQPEIDAERIGLAGYSQGGWISPLAASKTDAIKFVLVGYGMVDSPAEEDRKEAIHLLRTKGFGDAEVAEAEELIAAGHEVIRSRFDGGWERAGELKARFIRSEAQLVQNIGRDRLPLEQLRIEAVLSPGQWLLLSTTRAAKGLGENFFIQSPSGTLQRTLLLVRVAQTQLDDLFAPEHAASPLATPGD